MAWTTPLTATANATLTAAQWNASVRDNLNETAVAKATTAGSFFATTAANQIAERISERALVSDTETTASTSFTDLATAGPSVTVTTSTNAFAFISARLFNDNAGSEANMAYEVSGASSIDPSNTRALRYESSTNDDYMQASYIDMLTGLTPGSNVFTAKYRVTSGTGTFLNRRLGVIPM